MPKKITDDFTQTVKYRNDLSRIKKNNSEDLPLMDYIFILEKQNQDLKAKVEELAEIVEKLQKLP